VLILQNTSESRRRERKAVEQLIEVKDVMLDSDVGRVVNIHEEGFMLIGDGQIRENCLYQLALDLAEPVSAVDSLSVGAECLWMKETDSGTQYWAGFQIIDISDDDRAIITKITD
tara:strand:- start:253 stop:597 length:345 start_codon:yes stop_codon:yes gene_type:complete